METITGTVSKVATKQVTNKWGKPQVGVMVFLAGNDKSFACGFAPPGQSPEVIDLNKVVEGANVTISFEVTPKGYYNVASPIVVNAPPSANNSAGNSSINNKGSYQQDKEAATNFRAARMSAVEVVKWAVEKEIITLGSTKNKRLDNFLEHVDILTRRFYSSSQDTSKFLEEDTPAQEDEMDSLHEAVTE